MGWFDEQIRQRKESDQEAFEDSLLELGAAVLGESGADFLREQQFVTKDAVDEILKYYHCKPTEIPSSITDPQEQLEAALRPSGLAYRKIQLTEGWYKNTFGPLIALRKEDGAPVVLRPRAYSGYTWQEADGRKVTANAGTAQLLESEALCFYLPLPRKALGIPDLLGYMKNCLKGWDYIVLIALTLLVTLTGMMLPRITRFLTGFVLDSGNGLILWSTGAFLLCVLVSSQLLTASRELAMSRLQIKVAAPMEAAMMLRLMSLPAPFFRKYSAGELASRSWAVNDLCELLLGGVFSLGVTAISSLLYLNQVFLYAPALARPTILILTATLGVMAITFFFRQREAREFREAAAEESGVSYAILSGIQKIKLAGAEKRAFAKWAKAYSAGAGIEFDPPLFLKVNSAILMAIPLLGTVALYFFAARSGVTPSAYLAFSAAFGAVTGAFGAFAGIVNAAAEIRPILEMAEPILKTEPETADNREIVTKLTGNIELSGVTFRYEENGPVILDRLDLKIKPGEYVAIVGKTGCGKSTLLRLLLGFETPEKGAAFYNRKDLRSLDLGSLRRRMGVVTQDGSLFQGDIFSNITLSAPQLTLEDAWEAAQTAGIADDIRAMPMGMHTVIGEGQGGISGGQKQRILIARAIAPKPKILLFDEATSALDNLTQKQVSDALAGLDCTRIVIAHRLSTVKNCDRILVLDGGRIAEEGDYETLMKRGGLFAQLVERQQL